MKSFLILMSFVFLTAIATSFVLAVPLENNKQSEEKVIRTRRDLTGVFDSIGNGFESLVEGARKVGDSVFAAFNMVFSSSNENALTDGFKKFGQGVRDAFSGMFGEKGEKVTNGFKSVGDKIKSGWSKGGKDSSGGGSSDTNSPPAPQPKEAPDGSVPEGETT